MIRNQRETILSNPTGASDFLVEVAKGEVPGYSFIQKFGENEAVDTGTEPPGGNPTRPDLPKNLGIWDKLNLSFDGESLSTNQF